MDNVTKSTGNVFADLGLPEDELDAEDIKAALEELRQGKTIPWEEVKKDLDL